jgi:GT2 family glycosyltransferase
MSEHHRIDKQDPEFEIAEPVSVVIPTYNESRYIDACLESVSRQIYGLDRLEVLVIDGGSEDDTLRKADQWRNRIPRLRILENPGRHQSVALNIGLREASNDIIVRLDAHCLYAEDYVERCVAALHRTGATMVGGPMRPQGDTKFSEAVAEATTSKMGIGTGKFHYSDNEEYVDTVFLGAFRREEISALGGYDESIRPTGEDHELNYRITKAGGSVLLDPTIRSVYFPRGDGRSLWKQYWSYGQGKVSTLVKHGSLPTWRPLAPALFALWLVALPLSLPSATVRGGNAVVALIYVLLTGGAAMLRSRLRPVLAARIVVAFAIMHASYGLGFLQALVAAVARRCIPRSGD